jgi:hypothetical protein
MKKGEREARCLIAAGLLPAFFSFLFSFVKANAVKTVFAGCFFWPVHAMLEAYGG